MKACRDFGMEDGLTIPIHLLSRVPGIVSFAGQTSELSERDLKALELLCYHGYMRLIDLHLEQRESLPHLTPRQIDVLNHVATGKTDWEISKILDIGEYSVKEHLSEARRRLKAANRAHVVTIGIREGYIFL